MVFNRYFLKKDKGAWIFLNSKDLDWKALEELKKEADIVILAENEVKAISIANNDENLEIVKVTCYFSTESMEKSTAIEFYKDCVFNSEGCERQRYENILFKISFCGEKEVNDENF